MAFNSGTLEYLSAFVFQDLIQISIKEQQSPLCCVGTSHVSYSKAKSSKNLLLTISARVALAEILFYEIRVSLHTVLSLLGVPKCDHTLLSMREGFYIST